MGSVSHCEGQIAHVLRYQSSLDLLKGTYQVLAHLPLAKEIVVKSRQHLVARLDAYYTQHYSVLTQVVRLIEDEVLPGLTKAALAGHFDFHTSHPIFVENPLVRF